MSQLPKYDPRLVTPGEALLGPAPLTDDALHDFKSGSIIAIGAPVLAGNVRPLPAFKVPEGVLKRSIYAYVYYAKNGAVTDYCAFADVWLYYRSRRVLKVPIGSMVDPSNSCNGANEYVSLLGTGSSVGALILSLNLNQPGEPASGQVGLTPLHFTVNIDQVQIENVRCLDIAFLRLFVGCLTER